MYSRKILAILHGKDRILMLKGNSYYDMVDQMVSYGVKQGILHLYNEEDAVYKNMLVLNKKPVINFGSCSYLGLEYDTRLKEAAKKAIDDHGTQFAGSRAYISLKLYRELEQLLENIFEAYCVVTPTTTLGHIAAIPVLVGDDEAVIVDQQAHHSIQTAVTLLKPSGIHVEILRHSRMDILAGRIEFLSRRYPKVWYMADGIYSMFGDGCPVKEIYRLMDRYEPFHVYIDDAHGMSIYGKHGRGYVLDGRGLHKKMVLVSSLNKSFASGGGVLVFPDAESARKVQTCGGPMITSGPMQPAALGAAIAAATIHLSPEIYELQAELGEKRMFTRRLLEKSGLPLISDTDASVFFIGVGTPSAGYNIVRRMMNEGFYVNLGVFPAVPVNQTGVRFTITRLHRFAQIQAMVDALCTAFRSALNEEQFSLQKIYQAFKKPLPEPIYAGQNLHHNFRQSSSLKLFHYKSITEIKNSEWDKMFAGKGSFDWKGLLSLERSFHGNEKPEDNWLFDYLMIRDHAGEIVACTFLTTALWKDDMLYPAEVSLQVEERRKKDPYYMVSKVTAAGSLLTEGEHVYINKNSSLWKDALIMLTEKITEIGESYQAGNTVIRDFHIPWPELDDLMTDQGFLKINMPDTHIVRDMTWDFQDYCEHLSKRSKQHFREDVRKYIPCYDLSVIRGAITSKEADYFHRLYLNVKNHRLTLNTFPLPEKIFSSLLLNDHWEILVLRLKPHDKKEFLHDPVCMVYCYQSAGAYIPMIIGLDYAYNPGYKIYRQALYRIVMRARELGKEKILLGFSAGVEKKKVGAMALPSFAYVQNRDSYHAEVLEGISRESGKATFL